MGEIADMMLDGTMCGHCGVYLDDGESPGYPRLCDGCKLDEKKDARNEQKRKKRKKKKR